MFEDYLEDSYYFIMKAKEQEDLRNAKRYFRVSVFCSINAIEAFVNYVGEAFSQSRSLEPYEIAFLTDKPFLPTSGKFEIVYERAEYHRLEDKLRYLLCKFVPTFDFEKMSCWTRLIEFKKFRDVLTHPREDEDEIELDVYEKMTASGISSVIEIMDHLCLGIFKRPLRKKLLDLKIF